MERTLQNSAMDVNTLQGEPLGRVNMSKIKPYHEPLEAKAYVQEVDDTTNSSQRETFEDYTNKYSFQNTNHRNEKSSRSKIQCKFNEGQKVIRTYQLYIAK